MARFASRTWALGALALLGACATRTSVVVVVESDLPVSVVRATVGEGACDDARCVHDFVTDAPGALPFSFVLEPRGDASSAFTLDVAARDASGVSLVEQHVTSRFLPGRTLLLRVRLSAACRAVTCESIDTCDRGVCIARAIDPTTLPDVVPGHELDGLGDAGPSSDAPAIDAPVLPIDAPPTDASLDAPRIDAPFDGGGALPASCFDLPRAAPSGLTRIDPDGAGGDAPFDAWCENVADGGGWTLIAKVDPATTTLAYGATAWDAPIGAPIIVGTPDESLTDALLLPYWRVGITELRLGSGAAWVRLTSAGAPRGVLRAAMGTSLSFDQGLSDWAVLVGTPIHPSSPPCVHSGFGLRLPEAMPDIRVRIGVVGSTASDCSVPTFWYGVGASVSTSRSMCAATTNTAGAGRVCGPMPSRISAPAFVFVYGR